MRLTPFSLIVATVVLGVVSAPSPVAAAPAKEAVQVVAISDLHGRIARTTGSESRLFSGPGPDGVWAPDVPGESDDEVTRVGGAHYLATAVQRLQAGFRRDAGGSATSLFVGAGDLIGESPPVSADYKDEPTIEVFNALGLDVSAAGNWEFARGSQELRRLSTATDGQYGDAVTACQGVTPGVDGCFGTEAHAFAGANFTYLAANALSRETGEPMLPPYQIFHTAHGTRLALIGVVTESTPRHTGPEVVSDLEFIDESDAVNRWVGVLRDQGIEAIGVLAHVGGERTGAAVRDPNGCDDVTGPIADLNERVDPAVDFIVSGHTHDVYNCAMPAPDGQPRLVTQSGAYGRQITDIRLTLDRQTGDVDRAALYAATNVPAARTDADPEVQAIVEYWTAGPGNPSVDGEPGSSLDESGAPAGERDLRVEVGVVVLASVALVAALVWRRLERRRRQPETAADEL